MQEIVWFGQEVKTHVRARAHKRARKSVCISFASEHNLDIVYVRVCAVRVCVSARVHARAQNVSTRKQCDL